MTQELFEQVRDQQISLAQALGVSDGVVELFAILGSQHYEQGRNEDARIMFQAAATLNAKDYMGHAGLGVLDLVEDKLETAQTHLQTAYTLNARDTAVCCNLGEVYLRQERPADAKRYLEEAAALDSSRSDRYANRARAILSALP